MHTWSFRLAGLFALLSLLVFGTGVALADQDLKINMSEFKFDPSVATVRAGDKVNVTLANTGRFSHNLRIQGPGGAEVNVASANVAAGQTGSGSYTFSAPGTYTFWCPVGSHRAQGMEGTFQVVALNASLPRTGGLPIDPIGSTLAGMGGLSFAVGLLLRRRS